MVDVTKGVGTGRSFQRRGMREDEQCLAFSCARKKVKQHGLRPHLAKHISFKLGMPIDG